MKRLLFLTYRMAKGYGVDVVVANLARNLEAQGIRVDIACIDTDGFYSLNNIYLVSPNVESVARLARWLGVHALVAHTSPFYEILAQLSSEFSCWAWEHGDPTPEFFGSGAALRRQAKDFKLTHCYPHMKGVVAISEFIRRDIGYPSAHVIYNGCDHAPDWGDKPMCAGGPLRVGALMRLGAGEAKYKGSGELLEFFSRLDRSRFEPMLLGRGGKSDARPFEENGVRVVLNAEDKEKWRFLRDIDIFVSFSRWEGFNLPLVEAQAMGTPGLALRSTAHPEVTPLLFDNVDEALKLIESWGADRAKLHEQSLLVRARVRDVFSWKRSAQVCAALLNSALESESAASGVWPRIASYARRPKTLASIIKNRLQAALGTA